MNVSFAIMAHPERGEFVKQLMEEVPSAEVVWDDGHNVEWLTGARSWAAYDLSADYHVVIQDDALVCKEFEASVRHALEDVRGVPVSFYTGMPYPNYVGVKTALARAKAADKRWLAMSGPIWGVCLALPTRDIAPMIDWANKQSKYYDERIGDYYRMLDVPCWHSIPSLVDHRISPSLLEGHKTLGRKAHEWIGRNTSALKIDWEGVMPWKDASKWVWQRVQKGYQCGACGETLDSIPKIINHTYDSHQIGRVDFVATCDGSRQVMESILQKTYSEVRGKLYVIGKGGISPLKAKRVLSKYRGRFTIVDSYQALKYTEGRRTWSMDNKVEVDA